MAKLVGQSIWMTHQWFVMADAISNDASTGKVVRNHGSLIHDRIANYTTGEIIAYQEDYYGSILYPRPGKSARHGWN